VATKPVIEDDLKRVLREGTHGIRDLRCARQFQTYVKNSRGKTGPESGKFSDLLMAAGFFIRWRRRSRSGLPIRSGRRRGAT
jgi:hypothetical protein